jgi:hypothetical protein
MTSLVFTKKEKKFNKFNRLTYQVISSFVKKSELYNCLLFILIFENLQQLLLLNSDQTALQLTIISEVMHSESSTG